MKNESKFTSVFVDIDCILDTRMGTILKEYGKTKAMELAEDTDYLLREVDVFKGIPFDDFKEHYSKRDKTTLAMSKLTMLGDNLKGIINKILQTALTTPYDRVPKLFINVHGYNLTSDEKDLLKTAIYNITLNKTEILIVSVPPSKLKPAMIMRDNIDILIMYDYSDWLEAQTDNLAKTPIPGCTLLIPLLYKNYPITNKMKEDFKTNGFGDGFNYLKAITAPVINIEFFEPSHYVELTLVKKHLEKTDASTSQTV